MLAYRSRRPGGAPVGRSAKIHLAAIFPQFPFNPRSRKLTGGRYRRNATAPLPFHLLKYTIYEAINEETAEIYVGMTPLPMFEEMLRVKKNPPPSIAHWDWERVDAFRSVEFNMTKKEAEAFLEGYARATPPAGWRYVR